MNNPDSLFIQSCTFLSVPPPKVPFFLYYLKVLYQAPIVSVITYLFIRWLYFDMCLKFLVFTDYDEVIIPSKVLPSQVFLIIILSLYFLEIFSSLFLSLSVVHLFDTHLWPKLLVQVHPMMSTPQCSDLISSNILYYDLHVSYIV